MIYDVIDNVLPEHMNKFIANEVISTQRWRPAHAETQDVHQNYDGGMILLSFPSPHDDPVLNKLNTLGEIICSGVFSAHKPKGTFIDIEIDRFMYNYYTRSSKCGIHTDDTKTGQQPGQFLASFIYSLNDNDGHNIVNGQKIESKAGRCIIFSSSDYHSAEPPIEYPRRLTLNCAFKYSKYDADWAR